MRKFSTMWSEASRDRFSNRCHLSSGSSEEVWQQRLECSCSRGGDLPTSSSCSLLSFFADFLRSASSRWAWISDRRSAGGVAFEGISEKCHVRFHRATRRARLSQGRACDLMVIVRCSHFRHCRPFWFLSQFDLCFEVVGSHTLNFRSFEPDLFAVPRIDTIEPSCFLFGLLCRSEPAVHPCSPEGFCFLPARETWLSHCIGRIYRAWSIYLKSKSWFRSGSAGRR